MLDLTLTFSGEHAAGTLHRPVVCDVCETLLFGEDADEQDWERLAEVRLYVLRHLALASKRIRNRSDGCGWCSRAAEPVEMEWQDDAFEDMSLSNPRICPTCFALLGMTPFGFAVADEEQRDARLTVFAAIANAVETAQPPSVATDRRRSDELILVKLALLERDSHDYDLARFDGGYSELAYSLGLSRIEGEAEVARLLAASESPLTLRVVEGALAPRLSSRGWLRVRGLQKLYADGPPYGDAVLRSRSVRRALDELASDTADAA